MIIYNVTVKVDNRIREEWTKWMKEEHIPDLMKTGLFLDYRMCRLLEQDETDGRTYSIQYFCASLEDYNTYLSEHAPAMRQRTHKKFGDKLIAFRTVMEAE